MSGFVGKLIVRRGLIPGDPLSPLLFVLVAYSFTKMLLLVAEKNRLTYLSPDDYIGSLLIVQDDTFLFVNTSMEDVSNVLKSVFSMRVVKNHIMHKQITR